MATTVENNKRIAKNTMLLYFRMLFMMFIGLYTSRVVLKTLGVTDFGIYNVVGGVVTVFSFIKGSLNGATQRYITVELGHGSTLRLRRIFSISLSIHVLFSILIILLAETVGLWFLLHKMQIPADRMSAALWVYHGSIIAAVVMIMSAPYNAIIIAHEKMNVFAYISIVESILKLGIVFLLSYIPMDKLILYTILIVATQLLIQTCYKYYCNKHFKETLFCWYWDKLLFREILFYTGWTLNGYLAVVGYTQGLNILLNMFFNPIVNAARGIAVQVEGVVKSFCLNFQTALNPQLTKSYAQGNYMYMHRLLVISSKFSFFLIFFISLPVLFEISPLLKWWLGVIPEYTVNFVRIILILSMLSTMANPIIVSIHATGNIKYFQIVEGTILLSIVPLSYLLLKFTDVPPESVFIVYLIVEICAQYARIRIVLPQINMKIDDYVKGVIYPIAKVSILSLVVPTIVYYWLHEHTLCKFITILITCILCTGLSIYYTGCSVSEREMIKKQFGKICNKLLK